MPPESTATNIEAFLRRLEARYPTAPHRPEFKGSHQIFYDADDGNMKVLVWYRRPMFAHMNSQCFGLSPGDDFDDKLITAIASIIDPLLE